MECKVLNFIISNNITLYGIKIVKVFGTYYLLTNNMDLNPGPVGSYFNLSNSNYLIKYSSLYMFGKSIKSYIDLLNSHKDKINDILRLMEGKPSYTGIIVANIKDNSGSVLEEKTETKQTFKLLTKTKFIKINQNE